MKVNLEGLLRNASECIDPKLDRYGYAYMLEEVAGHIAGLRAGEHTMDEFAEFYCLGPKEKATV